MILRDEALKRIAPEERAKMGKAGMLASEAHEIAVAKCERELQGMLVNLLRLNGVNFVLNQRFGVKSTAPKGTPDIVFSYRGVCCAWEAKMPKEKPRQDQLDVMRDMTADGWQCHVVTSVDQALSLLAAMKEQPSQETV